MPRTTIADQLREVIRSRGLSGYELARLSGVNRSVVSRFLAGADLTLGSVDQLAAALGLRLVEVATRRNARRAPIGAPVDSTTGTSDGTPET